MSEAVVVAPAGDEEGRQLVISDPTLADLAASIEVEHQQVESHARAALDHARACGVLLGEAKARLPHGQWLDWLQANSSVSARTAQVYMRVAAGWQVLSEGNAQRVAHLSLREAVALLAEPKPADLPPIEPGALLGWACARFQARAERGEQLHAWGEAAMVAVKRELPSTDEERVDALRWMVELHRQGEQYEAEAAHLDAQDIADCKLMIPLVGALRDGFRKNPHVPRAEKGALLQTLTSLHREMVSRVEAADRQAERQARLERDLYLDVARGRRRSTPKAAARAAQEPA